MDSFMIKRSNGWTVLCKWKTRLASHNRFFIVTRANVPFVTIPLSLGIHFLIANVASLLYVSKSLFNRG